MVMVHRLMLVEAEIIITLVAEVALMEVLLLDGMLELEYLIPHTMLCGVLKQLQLMD